MWFGLAPCLGFGPFPPCLPRFRWRVCYFSLLPPPPRWPRVLWSPLPRFRWRVCYFALLPPPPRWPRVLWSPWLGLSRFRALSRLLFWFCLPGLGLFPPCGSFPRRSFRLGPPLFPWWAPLGLLLTHSFCFCPLAWAAPLLLAGLSSSASAPWPCSLGVVCKACRVFLFWLRPIFSRVPGLARGLSRSGLSRSGLRWGGPSFFYKVCSGSPVFKVVFLGAGFH